MIRIVPRGKTSRIAILLLVLLLLLSGSGMLKTLYASHSRFNTDRDKAPPPANEEDTFLVAMAQRFGLMALLADAVYRTDLPLGQRESDACAYLGPGAAPPPTWGMPFDATTGARWQRWVPGAAHRAVEPCFNAHGLFYETYVHLSATGQATEAVIAFRGTENTAHEVFVDWSTNLAAAIGLEPRQYALARERLPALIQALKQTFGDGLVIYAAGHSLGGGLAQQAGYLSRDIKGVYTFNTSPVTNWSSLRFLGAIDNPYPLIYRVYHGGEILEKVRFVTTSATNARYGRHDIGLQFSKRSSFGGHSMQILACHLAQIIARRQPAPDAEHHYPASYIRSQVLADPAGREPRICPAPTLKQNGS